MGWGISHGRHMGRGIRGHGPLGLPQKGKTRGRGFIQDRGRVGGEGGTGERGMRFRIFTSSFLVSLRILCSAYIATLEGTGTLISSLIPWNGPWPPNLAGDIEISLI